MLQKSILGLTAVAVIWLSQPLALVAQQPAKEVEWRVEWKFTDGSSEIDLADYTSKALAEKRGQQRMKDLNQARNIESNRTRSGGWQFPLIVSYRVFQIGQRIPQPTEADATIQNTYRTLITTLRADIRAIRRNQNVGDAVKRTAKFSVFLKGNTDRLSQSSLNQANALVNEFNALASQIASEGPVSPPPVPAPPANPGLAGSNFSGSENLSGFGDLQFRFSANGQVQMVDTAGSTPGSWSQNGSQVTLRFFNGQVTYSGSIRGNQIAGTASNGRKTWSWSVAR